MKNVEGCKYETMDHFICTYTHIYEFLKLMKSATKQNWDDDPDRSGGDSDGDDGFCLHSGSRNKRLCSYC